MISASRRVKPGVFLPPSPASVHQNLNYMNNNYAVRKLSDELEDQLLIQKSFESNTKSETTEKIREITERRIRDLEEALKILQPVTAL